MKEKIYNELDEIVVNEVISRRNKKNERLTPDEYVKLVEGIMLGDVEAYDRLLYLSFCESAYILREDYIVNGRKAQDFEDELDSIYLKLYDSMLNFACMTVREYKEYLNDKVHSELKILRDETLEKNAYLNDDWTNKVDKLPNHKAQPKNNKSCVK